MLRRRAPIIVFGLVLVLGAVAGFTLVWPRTYLSTALIVIEQRAGASDPTLSLLGQLGRASQIETEIELLESRHVVERVVDQLDLHAAVEPLRSTGDSGSFVGGLSEVARRALPLLPLPLPSPPRLRPHTLFPTFDATAEAVPAVYRVAARGDGAVGVWDAVSGRLVVAATRDGNGAATPGDSARLDWDESGRVLQFAGVTLSAPDSANWPAFDLHVLPFAGAVSATRGRVNASRRQRDADLIEVQCSGRTPESARELCQAILDSYMRLRRDLRRAEATATAEFLREQVDVLGQRLTVAEDSLEAYGSRYGAVALGERAAEEVRQLIQLTAQRDQLYAERSALSDLMGQIQGGGNGTRRYRDLASFPTLLGNQAVTQLLVSLVNLENDRSELRLRRSETSTDVTAVDGRIGQIEQQLLSIALGYRQALDAQIRSLDEALRTSGTRIALIPQRQVQAARLERQTSLLGDLYALLETRLREAEVAEAVNLPNVRIVDQASLPLGPSHPKPRLNLVLGSVLGLAFGLMLALYREGTDDSIRERRDVERQFGLPVLAITPRLEGAVSILPIPMLNRPRDSATLAETPAFLVRQRRSRAVGRQERQHRTRHRMTEDRRAALESFRSLAMDLRFATRHLNGGAPAVAVTSAVRGEGKTFVACNLALARSAQGARILLIDGDIRGGGAMRFFGLPASAPGLSDVLAASPAVGADEGVWKGAVNGAELWVLPPGTPSLYSARIFEFPKFATLLEQAKLQFDLIVIDTPPINVITDAAPITAVSDAVLLVVRGSFTTRDCLELTLERLGRARSYVVGAVLNDVEPPRHYATGYEYSEAVELRT